MNIEDMIEKLEDIEHFDSIVFRDKKIYEMESEELGIKKHPLVKIIWTYGKGTRSFTTVSDFLKWLEKQS